MTDLLVYDDDKAMALMDGAATVNRIVRTVPAERLRSTRLGEWSAVEALGHLAATAEVFAERVRRALEEETPTLPSMPAGAGADPNADPMDLARRLLRAHQAIVARLQDPAARERPAVHTDWGRVTAGHIAAYQADHTAEHVTELGAAFPPEG